MLRGIVQSYQAEYVSYCGKCQTDCCDVKFKLPQKNRKHKAVGVLRFGGHLANVESLKL